MASTAPTITSVDYDKPGGYTEGDTGTVVVKYGRGTSDQSQTSTWTATDTQTNLTGTMAQTFTVSAPNPTTISGTDEGSRVYQLIDDDGVGTATFQFTA